MIVKRTLLLSIAVLAAIALAAPTAASAFKLVKAEGGGITKTTEIHITAHAEFNHGAFNGIKCEVNASIKTSNGEANATVLTNIEVITNTCKGFGIYAKCAMTADAPNSVGFATIEKNALLFNFSMISNLAGCFTVGWDVFTPLKIFVGTGPITSGLLEGEGTVETDEGKGKLSLSGTVTIGQYTEEGVNKGSAKGVFKIE